MAANNQTSETPKANNLSEQEKIQEFIRELAIAFRRITGRIIENGIEGLPVDAGKVGDKDFDISDSEDANNNSSEKTE
jgi:hypothetical protein